MDIDDDDIVIIQDNRPKEPTVDPLDISQVSTTFSQKETDYLDNYSVLRKRGRGNVINLDSSDDENCSDNKRSQMPITYANSVKNVLKAKAQKVTILQQPKNKLLQLNSDIIDLDAEDSDPLAPLRLLMNPIKKQGQSDPVTSAKNTSEKVIRSKNQVTSVPIVKNSGNIPISNQNLQKISLNQSCKSRFKIIRKENTCLIDKNIVSKRPTTHSNTDKRKIIVSKPSPKLACNSSNKISKDKFDEQSSSVNKSSMNPNLTKKLKEANQTNNFKATEVAKTQNLTYLGKLICIPGQPSLIENSSGLIFKVNDNLSESLSNLTNVAVDNVETEMNRYSNISNNQSDIAYNGALGHVISHAIQNMDFNNLVIQRSNVAKSDEVNNRLIISKKTFPSKNKSESCQKPKHKNIKERTENLHTPIITPYHQCREPNSTVVDLNLNINDTISSIDTNTTPDIFQSQKSLLLNDSQKRYNVALGLVLNVNDNESNSSYPIVPANQLTNLNNVALDVSFNVNNKKKPATITSQQVLESSLKSTIHADSLDGNVNAYRKTTYCCSACSFKTDNFRLVNSHRCSIFSSPLQNEPCISKNDISPNKTLIVNKPGNMYCCQCSFKTLDFEVMKSHKNICSDFSVFNFDQQNIITPSCNNNPTLEKMYCCVACSFKTAKLNVMNSHICPIVILPNKANTNFGSLNLEHNEISVQNSLMEMEKNEKETVKNIYKCVACSFQATNLEVMKSHNCLLVTNNMLATESTKGKKPTSEKTEQEMSQIYCCVSCSFQSASLKLVESHRCRKDNLNSPTIQHNKPLNDQLPEKIPDTEINLKTKFVDGHTFLCKICGRVLKACELFQHLRIVHYNFHKRFGCYLCARIFKDTRELLHHLKLTHSAVQEDISTITSREVFMCNACVYRNRSFTQILIHIDEHMNTYKAQVQNISSPDQQVVNRYLKTHKNFYECSNCGQRTKNIDTWLKHACNQRKDQTSLEQKNCTTGECERIELSGVLCQNCEHEISNEVLKCDNSGCENWYHLNCVNARVQCQNSEVINKISSWFCQECNNINMECVPLIQYDIDKMNLSLDLTDERYLKEVKKQRSIVNELNKIKEEKVTMKKEFEQIKKFIMNCKSEKINNDIVKSVCTVVESFINAGSDSSV